MRCRMRKFRWNYWSCSRFADWVRGEEKPLALGFGEWEDWRRGNAARRPIRFFLAETVLDWIQNLWMLPWDLAESIHAWWHNRFVSKTHYLKTGLKPGKFHELDERIMHGLFNELVEFVEVDLAHMGSYGEGKKYRFLFGRCPEAGVDHLLWAKDLTQGEDGFVQEGDPDYNKPTPQAESAAEILKIYIWWKRVRPFRPDPHDESRWSEFYDQEESEERHAAANRLEEIEAEYESEDDAMLHTLIKIRRHLWT